MNFETETDPDLSEHPPEVQRFGERVVRTSDEIPADGELLWDRLAHVVMAAPDVTYYGTADDERTHIDPADCTYDRVERIDAPDSWSDDTMGLWVFDYDGQDVPIRWEYASVARDVFEMSADEIKETAQVLPETTIELPQVWLAPDDAEYRMVIMPHKGLLDDDGGDEDEDGGGG